QTYPGHRCLRHSSHPPPTCSQGAGEEIWPNQTISDVSICKYLQIEEGNIDPCKVFQTNFPSCQ
ncbi:hypothetical protein J6590_091227, partial [Homalodisca vitripennis]